MRKLYTVMSAKEIPCMGGIQGPMTEPVPMKFDDVLEMVCRGYEIYQHNPHKLSEKKLVTKRNIGNIHFETSKAAAISEKETIKELQTLNRPASELRKKNTKKVDSAQPATETTAKVDTPDVFEKN